MDCKGTTYVYRFLVANVLTVVYSLTALFSIILSYVRSFFKRTTSKRRLEPPAALTDPKYGVHKYIKVNNIKLHYVESGDSSRPLMLFIHGFPEFWYAWRHQIVEFKKDYWCIAMDTRGYGDSEKPDGVAPYRMEELIRDVRDLIRQLGREKCIIISHDYGGAITARFRDVYPEMVSACVLLSSLSLECWMKAIWTVPAQRKKSWYMFLFRAPSLPEQLLQSDDLVFFERSMLVPGKSTVTTEDVECYKYWFGKTLGFTPPINYYRANFEYTMLERHRTEQVPMLVAHPANENYLQPVTLEMMANEGGAETAIIPDSSHFVQQEEPEKVNKLIREFLHTHNL